MKRGSDNGLLAQQLLALCLAGWLVFDFPLLKLLLGSGAGAATTLIFGLPRGPFALFLAWALLIVLLAWLMERSGRDEPAPSSADAAPPTPPIGR